jgi:hypothetical protein
VVDRRQHRTSSAGECGILKAEGNVQLTAHTVPVMLCPD